jgi:hypothetical protein
MGEVSPKVTERACLCQQKNPPAKRKKKADISQNLPAPLANRPEMW